MPAAIPTADEVRALIREELAPLLQVLARLDARGSRPRAVVAEHIDIGRLCERLGGRGRSTIGDWVRAGTFPRPHHCGRVRCWLVSEIEAWEAARPTRAEARPGSAS